MPRTRLMTLSLAGLAVASTVTLAAPAHAEGTCAPARPALYTTLQHDPVTEVVPAVTHSEWQWQRLVDTTEFEYARVLAEEVTEVLWARTVAGPVEHQWSRVVVDVPAIPATPGTPEVGHTETIVVAPAVTETLFEFRNLANGKLRWENASWGAVNGQGWELTGNTQTVVITAEVTVEVWIIDVPAMPGTPEVPAVTHLETLWATEQPGSEWVGTGETRPGPTQVETMTTSGAMPPGEGWAPLSATTTPAVIDRVWASSAPDGYSPTGNMRTETTLEVFPGTSELPPPGSGWLPVEGSEIVVIDVPATTRVLEPGWTEQVLVSPAQDAEECEEPSGSVVAGPVVEGAGSVSPAARHQVLPETGSPVDPWMLLLSLGTLSGGLITVYRSGRSRG